MPRVSKSGLDRNNPAIALIDPLLTYGPSPTDGDGAATGTTVVCSDLDNWPTYIGNKIKILSGNAIGQERVILGHAAGGILTVDSPFTDSTGAVEQIVTGTIFVILGNSGGGGSSGPSPSIGLWMFGVCSPGMAGSTTAIVCSNLMSFPDDIFNDDFYMEVLRNDNNVGLAPEHEIRKITDYVGATGTFTTDAFSSNVEADDLVAIIHHTLIGPELNLLSTIAKNVFDIVNASLVTTETGGTLTADGTEQNLFINNTPAGVHEPLMIQVDCTNMGAGDTIVLRTYYRINNGGNLIKEDEVTIADAQDPDLKTLELRPNRFGLQITLEQSGGVNRDFDWSIIYRG